jgi:hypothetical protein
MALNAKQVPGGGKKFAPQAPIEPGTYPARIAQIIDFGLQPQPDYQGAAKPPAQEVGFTYELVDEFMKDEQGKDITDKPRWVSENFPLRNLDSDNARSTARYNVFDPQHSLYDGDFTALIGLPCNVTIVNNVSKGNTYSNVANVSAMRPRDAQACPELKNKANVFDSDNPDIQVFLGFPKWIQDKIKGNLKYKGSKLEALVDAAPKAPEKEEVKKEVVTESNNPY